MGPYNGTMGDNKPMGSMAGNSGVFGQIVGTGLGLLTANYNDRRQTRMNEEMLRQEIEANKTMGRWNQGQALEMFEATGYGAQRRQMEEAGLNPGLMYGQAGGMGTTSGGQGGGMSGAKAPVGGGELGMGMQLGLQGAMLQAQIENIKADTAVKQRDAGVDVKGKTAADIENVAADTANKKVQNALYKLDTELKDIEREVLTGQKENAISLMESAARKAFTEAGITEATAPDKIQLVKTGVQEAALRVEAQQKGLIKTDADIDAVKASTSKMFQEIRNMVSQNSREWDKLSLDNKRQMVEEKIMQIGKQTTEFNTSTPQQIRQWTDLIMSVLTLGIGAQGGSQPAGFKFK